MIKQKGTGTYLEFLMDMLASNIGSTRQKARKTLVALGKPAVSSLIEALQLSRLDFVRWEAAKALGAIGDTKAVPSLVKVLEDSNRDVAWLAADALSKFKKDAWPPLLHALMKNGSDSVLLREGAHHVFRDQKVNGFNDLLTILVKDLASNTVQGSTPVAAYEILKRMKATS